MYVVRYDLKNTQTKEILTKVAIFDKFLQAVRFAKTLSYNSGKYVMVTNPVIDDRTDLIEQNRINYA